MKFLISSSHFQEIIQSFTHVNCFEKRRHKHRSWVLIYRRRAESLSWNNIVTAPDEFHGFRSGGPTSKFTSDITVSILFQYFNKSVNDTLSKKSLFWSWSCIVLRRSELYDHNNSKFNTFRADPKKSTFFWSLCCNNFHLTTMEMKCDFSTLKENNLLLFSLCF